MDTAKLFTNGRSQAVRLPKEFRFEGTEVMVTRLGSAVVLLPKDHGWDVLFEALDGFTDDFMAQREQPPVQERDLDFGA
jgi:antitoxin VapB